MATIREATGVIAKSPELKGEVLSDLATMDRFRQMILTVERQNRNWMIPRFGLNESVKVEKALKTNYCKQFQDRFLIPPDKEMGGAVAGFSMATPDDAVAPYIVHLVRRINLLKSRLDGAGFDSLRSKPLPSYILSSTPQAEESEISRKFGQMYVTYLVWRSDTTDITKEILILQTWLKQVITVKGANLRWLLNWANRQGVAPSLTLHSFWGGSRTMSEDVSIPSVYTRKGKEIVSAFVNELLAAYPEPAVLEREKINFESWYRSSCFSAWQRFATLFPTGEERLNGAKEWQAAAVVMASEESPYTTFFNKVISELEPFGVATEAPAWIQQIFQYRILKSAGLTSGAATKTVEEGKKLAGQVGQLFGKQVATESPADTQIAAAKAVQEYLGAISAIAPVAKSRAEAYKLTLQVFTEDSVNSKSPFYVAYDSLQRIKGYLSGGRVDETFSRLISGPLMFYWAYVRMETACTIQGQWEEKVLKEAQGAGDQQTLQYLLSKEGPVWKFVSGTVDPFMGWNSQRGYYSKVVLGGSIPFQPSFFSFLFKGTKIKMAAPAKQNNTVSIKGFPTDANSDALIKPQSTRLELQCASGPQVIENLNFPVSKTFIWSPDTCADVVFQIDIGDLILTKKYPGPQGFPDFLHSFPGGRHIFYPKDFPREKRSLERMGISFIRVNYQISGGLDIAGHGKDLPGQAPRVITQCWN
jgi:type VI secretion system protein ImpL